MNIQSTPGTVNLTHFRRSPAPSGVKSRNCSYEFTSLNEIFYVFLHILASLGIVVTAKWIIYLNFWHTNKILKSEFGLCILYQSAEGGDETKGQADRLWCSKFGSNPVPMRTYQFMRFRRKISPNSPIMVTINSNAFSLWEALAQRSGTTIIG